VRITIAPPVNSQLPNNGQNVIAAVLSDQVGSYWVWGQMPSNLPAFALFGTQPGFGGVLNYDSGSESLTFLPSRNEYGAALTLNAYFGLDSNGNPVYEVARITGGSVVLALRDPQPASTPPQPPVTTADALTSLLSGTSGPGTINLASGTFTFNQPLSINYPVTITGTSGTILQFTPPSTPTPQDPAWTANGAINITCSNVTLSDFTVDVRQPSGSWNTNDWSAQFPSVIWVNNNVVNTTIGGAQQAQGMTLWGEAVQPTPPGQPLSDEPVFAVYTGWPMVSGTFGYNTVRGGPANFAGGPWQITNNQFGGPMDADQLSPGALAFTQTHDVNASNNHVSLAYQPDANSPPNSWAEIDRLANWGGPGTYTGFNDVLDHNTFGSGAGAGKHTNNGGEVVLTEGYAPFYQGVPLAISPSRQLLEIPYLRGDAPAPGDEVSIIADPSQPSLVGDYFMIAQAVNATTYIMLPDATGQYMPSLQDGDYTIEINQGFVGETYSNNTIDLTDVQGGDVGLELGASMFKPRIEYNRA
jgi:hypothetical protein